MTLEDYRAFCLSLPHVTEGFPFDANTLVFKVGGKMFALMDAESFDGINLKCNPDEAVELRESYSGITGGFHMNKKHWNTIYLHTDVDDKMLLALTKISYDIVFDGLPKKIKNELTLR